MIFNNATIYLEKEVIQKGWLEILEGKIINYGIGEKAGESINLMGNLMLPGFIDQHMHGTMGFDVMDGTIESLLHISKALPQEGVTSFLATTITQSNEKIKDVLINIHDYINGYNNHGAEVLGVHLEGPFISKEYAGAHLKEFIQKPTLEVFQQYQQASGNSIRMVTLSPEEDEDHRLIKYLRNQGIVASIGHTKAKYQEVQVAVENGATGVTHLYNAMLGVHHQELGVVGAALMLEELKAELICDGIHVCKEAVRLLYQNKGREGIILVTDAMRAKELTEGTYELGGQLVYLKEDGVRTAEGKLAGSVLRMDNAIQNMMNYTKCSLREAIQMGSENPAKHLGIYHRKGSIALGKDADIVVLDENFNVKMTICKGQIVYRGDDKR